MASRQRWCWLEPPAVVLLCPGPLFDQLLFLSYQQHPSTATGHSSAATTSGPIWTMEMPSSCVDWLTSVGTAKPSPIQTDIKPLKATEMSGGIVWAASRDGPAATVATLSP